MRSRALLLPAAAILLTGVVYYAETRPPAPRVPLVAARGPVSRAPDLQGLDSKNDFFRLQRYLGRTALVVVFFDRAAGAQADSTLQFLRDHEAQIRQAGCQVVAVSSALPQENRAAGYPDSFEFVTDVEPIYEAHRRWGCFDEQADRPVPAVFHIDRAGNVAKKNDLPVPLTSPRNDIARLLGLTTPQPQKADGP